MKRLENLEKTAIRSEFKLEIYKIYILPSIRFLLTVHDLPISLLSRLDTMADQYLKKWAGLPKCATNAILHLNTALDIQKISTLYKEVHATSHCSTRLKGDRGVNLAIDNRLVRESQLVRKQSITVQSEEIYQRAFGRNTVQGEIPGCTPENKQGGQSLNNSLNPISDGTQIPTTEIIKPSSEFISGVKQEAKSLVSVEDNGKMLEHVQNLVKQGKFLELSQCEKNDATWKGYIFNLPKGTMKWLLNASIDTLPTKVNLKLWGKVSNDKCFCGQKQTLNHILNCCTLSLNQGRYTYRHDSILNYILSCLDSIKFTCYVDVPGHQTQDGGTIPPDIMVTTLKPDLVIIDKQRKSLNIFELTVPGETRISIAHNIKLQKYQHFCTDINSYKVSVIPFEIGSHTGYITRENKESLKTLHKFCKRELKFKSFKNSISVITVLGSYFLFNNRNIETWQTPSNFIYVPMIN